MFYGATAFNQDISNWNISNVTNMEYMFYNATSFNQDISSWNVDNVLDCNDIFNGSGILAAYKPSFTSCSD
ncbi:hypothetical protein CL647_02785 [bacterium]|nr:hypothetical protein [bacterium]